MRPALDSAGHRVPRTKSTWLLHTWRHHRQRPFALVLHLLQPQSSRNLHLQYLAKNQSTQNCQSLITPGSDHPPVLEPHMVLSLDCLGAVSGLGPPRQSLSTVPSRLGTASTPAGISLNASGPRCGLRLADLVSPRGLANWRFRRNF
jgi:hypothetical protein